MINRALTNALTPKKFWLWGLPMALFCANIFGHYLEIWGVLTYPAIKRLILLPAEQQSILEQWAKTTAEDPTSLLKILATIAGAFVLVKLAGLILEGALVLAFKHKSAKRQIGLGQSLLFGLKNFKKVFWIRFQLFGLLVLTTIGISFPLSSFLNGTGQFWGRLLFFLGVALWFFIFFALALVGQLAVFGAILKEQGVAEALNQAYALVFSGSTKNKKEILTLWVGEKVSLLLFWLLEILFVLKIIPFAFDYAGYSTEQGLLPMLLYSFLISVLCQNVRIIFAKNLWFLFFKKKNAIKIKKVKAKDAVTEIKVATGN